MSTDLPTHRYFRPKHGRWRGVIRFTVTDRAAMRASGMRWRDRVRVLAMTWLEALAGPAVLETTVDYLSRGPLHGEVAHTTRLVKFGLTLMSSREVFLLDPNGRDARVRGESRFFPLPWPTHDFGDGHLVVDETGECATYTFDWLGTPLRQTTRPVPDADGAKGGGMEIVQETAWSRSVVILR